MLPLIISSNFLNHSSNKWLKSPLQKKICCFIMACCLSWAISANVTSASILLHIVLVIVCSLLNLGRFLLTSIPFLCTFIFKDCALLCNQISIPDSQIACLLNSITNKSIFFDTSIFFLISCNLSNSFFLSLFCCAMKKSSVVRCATPVDRNFAPCIFAFLIFSFLSFEWHCFICLLSFLYCFNN